MGSYGIGKNYDPADEIQGETFLRAGDPKLFGGLKYELHTVICYVTDYAESEYQFRNVRLSILFMEQFGNVSRHGTRIG